MKKTENGLTFLLGWLTPLLAAGGNAFLDGSGGGDLLAFTAWTFPLACILLMLVLVVGNRLSKLHWWQGIAVIPLFAFLTAYAWTWSVAKFLGLWFRLFSFPVFFCWLAGSLGVFIFASFPAPTRVSCIKRFFVVLLVTTALGVELPFLLSRIL